VVNRRGRRSSPGYVHQSSRRHARIGGGPAGPASGRFTPGCRVVGLRYLSPGFEVLFDPPQSQPLKTDAVVLATPAYTAAVRLNLLRRAWPRFCKKYATSPPRPFRWLSPADLPAQCDLNGFGFMILKVKTPDPGLHLVSTKFNHRASADDVLLRLFVGGDQRSTWLKIWPTRTCSRWPRRGWDDYGIIAQPLVQRVFRWPKGNRSTCRPSRPGGRHGAGRGHFPAVLTGSAFRGIGLPIALKARSRPLKVAV